MKKEIGKLRITITHDVPGRTDEIELGFVMDRIRRKENEPFAEFFDLNKSRPSHIKLDFDGETILEEDY